jgi:hypothetical protein
MTTYLNSMKIKVLVAFQIETSHFLFGSGNAVHEKGRTLGYGRGRGGYPGHGTSIAVNASK